MGVTSAVHRLAAAGQIGLDDPVARHLSSSPCARATTIRDLLQHRAGLWEWQPLYLSDQPEATVDRLPLRYPPGSARHYSDLGFILLGRIVAAVAAAPLDVALRQVVLDPVGLHETGFGPLDGDVASSAVGDGAERRMVAAGEPYPILTDRREFAWREHELRGEVNDGNCFHAFGGVSGHAGLFSTARDLLKIGAALAARHLDPGWGTEVSQEVFSDAADPGQALGWRSIPVAFHGKRRRLMWHGGYTGCALGFLPGEELVVLMLTNRLLADRVPEVTAQWTAVLAAMPDLTQLSDTEGMT